MKKKLALITGGTSGIGLGIAEELMPDFHLALVFGSDEAKAEKALGELKSKNPEAQIQVFKKNMKTAEDCQALYKEVCEAFGGQTPSILVNSAGRLADGLFLQSSFESIQNLINEHLILSMALSQLAVKSMYKDKWGRIINLSSISASYSKRGQSAYAAAKAGIEAFTSVLALEVAHRGITVNAIAPGLIQTSMTEEMIKKIEDSGDSIRDRIPAGRFGLPSDVGHLAAFLCSEKAGYITGTTVTIDGGRSLGDPRS